MSSRGPNGMLLRLRLALRRFGPVACAAALLCVLAVAAWAWLTPQRALLDRKHAIALRQAALPPPPVTSMPVAANENLALFRDSLGDQRYAEQQVATLFALAAKSGLTLSMGEYQSGYDRNARVHTYQVLLPVKGNYGAVWKFGMQALRAIPFASLDDISFRRDTIGDASVEARLRLTLYLAAPGTRVAQ